MGHNITGIVVKGEVQLNALKAWDLVLEKLPFGLNLVYIDGYYTACWQKLKNLKGNLPCSSNLPTWFPTEIVILAIARELTEKQEPSFAIIQTDYFGSAGDQYAQLFKGSKNVFTDIVSINQVLSFFGVKRSNSIDEFDTVGLGKFRSNPEYLEKYIDIAEELEV